LQERVRALRRLAEHPPDDLKPEDRASVVRDTLSRVKQLEQELAAGDRAETGRQDALESHQQRFEQLPRLLHQERDKSFPEQPAEAIRRKAEIENLKRSIANVEQQRKAWRKEREQLRAVMEEWKKIVEQARPDKRKDKETVLKELERQLTSDEREDQNRQIELDLLIKRLKALEQPAPE
jgi:hypothetical protein